MITEKNGVHANGLKQLVPGNGLSEISITSHRSRGDPNVDRGWAWVALGAAFVIQLTGVGIILAMGIFYSELVEEFGRNPEDIAATAWLISASLGANTLIGPFGGIMANWFGYSHTIAIGGLIAAIGFAITYFAQRFWVVLLCFAIVPGAGLGMALSPSFGVIAFYFVKRKKFATTFMTLNVGLSLMVFPPFLRYLIGIYTWRGTSLVMAGFCLHIIPCAYLFTHRKVAPATSFAQYADTSLFSKISFYLLMGNFLLVGGGYNLWNVSGMRYAIRHCGISETDAPWLYSVQGLLNICGRLSAMACGFHRWTETTQARWNIHNVWTIAGGFSLALFGAATSFQWLAVWSGGIGYFIGGRFALLPALVIDLFSQKRFTTSWAYGTFLVGLGSLFIPSIGDFFAFRTGTASAPFYLAGVCVIVGCCISLPLAHCLPTSKDLKNGELAIKKTYVI